MVDAIDSFVDGLFDFQAAAIETPESTFESGIVVKDLIGLFRRFVSLVSSDTLKNIQPQPEVS